MSVRTDRMVQPGVLSFEEARVYLRVEVKGRNLGILIQTKEGTLRSFVVETHPTILGAVAMIEVSP